MALIKSHVLKLVDGPDVDPLPDGPSTVDVPSDNIAPGVTLKDGALSVDQPDGSVVIDFNPDLSKGESPDDGFYANLANKIDDGKLSQIATELLDGIQRDMDSRSEWMQTRAQGIRLLGLKLEEPRGDIGTSSAPLEGMSVVRHPLLLESTVRFQATARGELLPAAGPVKVRNDQTMPPKPPPSMPPMDNTPGGPAPPPLGHNGGPSIEATDDLADALEKDMNHYLTVIAREYVPDTDRMLFYIGFGGDGFKKVFNCPLRRRPVSESVDAEDLIISNSATDIANCGRVTHKIKMRKATLKRMQIIKAYRDVDLGVPVPATTTPVDQEKAAIAGQQPRAKRPEDEDYTVYESYCELDLDEFAPAKLKGKGLPLPYRVTIEKDSRQVLSVIRNWEKEDSQALAKQFFVQFPFIRGLGFYGIGFVHLLGNTTNALTAAWREMLDAGMFANFPGFLHAKQLGRQLTNQFRVPPGGGIGLELGAQQDIRSVVMALPYKEPGPAFTAFVSHIEEVGQRLGTTAEIQVGEGKQDAPVGTTLALIEQATKMLDAVHKRLHAAQAEEFGLLKQRFKEDPEAFWRHNKRTTVPWKKEQFLKALENNDLVPVADPNNPTSLHRMAKANLVKQLSVASPQLYNTQAVDTRIFRMTGIDPEGLFNAQPTPPPPDPRMQAIKQKAETSAQQIKAQQEDARQKAQLTVMQLQDKAQDRESRELIAKLKLLLEDKKIEEEKIVHSHDLVQDHAKTAMELQNEHAKTQAELEADKQRAGQEMQISHAQGLQDTHAQGVAHAQNIQREREAHEHKTTMAHEQHQQKMEHQRQLHTQKLEHEKQLAEVRKKTMLTKPKGKSDG